MTGSLAGLAGANSILAPEPAFVYPPAKTPFEMSTVGKVAHRQSVSELHKVQEDKKGEKKTKLPPLAEGVVKVEIQPSEEEGGEEIFTTSEDEKKIAELLEFFPELGRNSTNIADASPTYGIKFLRKDGKCFSIYVHLSSNLNCWYGGGGLGNWDLKDPERFKKLMDSFLAKRKKKEGKKEAQACDGGGPRKNAADIIADTVKVEIQRAPNRNKRRMREQTVTIEDKKKIAKLLAFFPEIGKDSDHTGLWVADYHIKFTLKKGDPICVRVSWDLKWWSDLTEELGDWPLKEPEKFEKLIDDWIKKK